MYQATDDQRTLEENHEKVETSLHVSITELYEKLVNIFVCGNILLYFVDFLLKKNNNRGASIVESWNTFSCQHADANLSLFFTACDRFSTGSEVELSLKADLHISSHNVSTGMSL